MNSYAHAFSILRRSSEGRFKVNLRIAIADPAMGRFDTAECLKQWPLSLGYPSRWRCRREEPRGIAQLVGDGCDDLNSGWLSD
jgi:hypothetical protein